MAHRPDGEEPAPTRWTPDVVPAAVEVVRMMPRFAIAILHEDTRIKNRSHHRQLFPMLRMPSSTGLVRRQTILFTHPPVNLPLLLNSALRFALRSSCD